MKKYLLLSLFLLPFYSYAQTMWVFDRRSIEQVGKNSTAIIAQENLINNELLEIKKEQNKVLAMVTVVEENLKKIEKAQKDASAFRQEAPTIKLFVVKLGHTLRAVESLTHTLKAKNTLSLIANSKIIFGITQDIYGLCHDMVTTVCNGQVVIPGLPRQPERINFMEPQERLALYNRYINNLDIIYYKIKHIELCIVSSNTIDAVLLNLSPSTFSLKLKGQHIAKDIMRLWEK